MIMQNMNNNSKKKYEPGELRLARGYVPVLLRTNNSSVID
jgi:hypothetical protein